MAKSNHKNLAKCFFITFPRHIPPRVVGEYEQRYKAQSLDIGLPLPDKTGREQYDSGT